MTSFELTQWQIAVDALPLGVVIFAENGTEEWRNSVASKMGGARHTDVLIDEAINHVGRRVVAGEAATSQLDLAGPPPRRAPVARGIASMTEAMSAVSDWRKRSNC